MFQPLFSLTLNMKIHFGTSVCKTVSMKNKISLFIALLFVGFSADSVTPTGLRSVNNTAFQAGRSFAIQDPLWYHGCR